MLPNIKNLQWQPNNIKPPYFDGVLTIYFKERQIIKGMNRDSINVECNVNEADEKFKKFRRYRYENRNN